jgi:hypothetical protein
VPVRAPASAIGEDGDFGQSPFEMVIRTLKIAASD